MYSVAKRSLDTLRRDLRVHQILDEKTAQFSYLIACVRTGAAALIDPSPRLATALYALVIQHRLKVRYTLYTAQRDAGGPRIADTPSSHIYHGLLSKLGLNLDDGTALDEDDDDVAVDESMLWWHSLPVVRPLAHDPSTKNAESLLLQAGAETIGVRLPAALDDDTGWTLGGSLHRPVTGRICGQLRVALGAFHLVVLPLPDHVGRVAYACPGSILTGRDTTDMAVLATITPDTLLYPRDLANDQFVGNVAQARHATARRGGTGSSTPNHDSSPSNHLTQRTQGRS